MCKPLDMEHLKFNYGEVRQAEEKKRRVTLAAMPSQCQRRDNFANQDSPDRVRVEKLHNTIPRLLSNYQFVKLRQKLRVPHKS